MKEFIFISKSLSPIKVINVSIPHRFNSHIELAIKNNLTDWVSIPHRFNSHDLITFCALFLFLFQSLTGSIHTTTTNRAFVVVKMFQSLTGSIHTKKLNRLLHPSK
jgi:hypothetical protein